MPRTPPTVATVPDPGARPRIDGLLGAALAGLAAAVLFYSTHVPAPHVPFALLGVGLPVAVGVAALVLVLGRPRRRRLTRAGDLVLGMRGGPLPAGVGRIVVERVAHRGGEGTAFLYELRHEGVPGHGPRTLVRRGYQATRLRACAEGLCRLGGYPMVWKDPGGDEVRDPAELDAPLLDRLAAGHPAGDGHADVAPAATRPLPGGGVAIASTGLAPRAWALTLGAFVAVGAVNGLTDVAPYGAPWYQPLTRDLAIWAGAAVLLYLSVQALRGRLEVDPAGVRVAWTFAGIPLRRRTLPAATTESLYIEEGQMFHSLVVAGDGFHQRAGRFGSLADAVAARRAVIEALAHG